MPDNRFQYGFVEWQRITSGAAVPKQIADAYQATVGGSNVDVGVGDPVKLVSDGTVALAAATESIWGVIVAVRQYWDGTRVITGGKVIPGASTGGGLYARRSEVLVLPANYARWSLMADDKVTATTRAGYQAFVGENTEISLTRTLFNGVYRASPRCDISLHATTAALIMRIEEISLTKDNASFAEANVHLICTVNHGQQAGQAATAIAGV